MDLLVKREPVVKEEVCDISCGSVTQEETEAIPMILPPCELDVKREPSDVNGFAELMLSNFLSRVTGTVKSEMEIPIDSTIYNEGCEERTNSQNPVKSAYKKKKVPTTKRVHLPSHPTYSNMLHRAIKVLKVPRGSSFQAILKFIMAKYNLVHDEKRIRSRAKAALFKMLAAGVVLRGKTGRGASGVFRLSTCKNPAKRAVSGASSVLPAELDVGCYNPLSETNAVFVKSESMVKEENRDCSPPELTLEDILRNNYNATMMK